MTTVNLFYANDVTNQAFAAVAGQRGPHANGSLMQITVLKSYLFLDVSDLISGGGVTLTDANCPSIWVVRSNLFRFQSGFLKRSFLILSIQCFVLLGFFFWWGGGVGRSQVNDSGHPPPPPFFYFGTCLPLWTLASVHFLVGVCPGQ